MEPVRFSTHAFAPEQQLEAWQAWFDPVLAVVPFDDAKAGFPAVSQVWTLDRIMIGKTAGPRLRTLRTKTLIRRNPVDHWIIAVGQRDTLVRSNDTDQRVPGGTPFVVSLGNELVSEREQDERLHCYLPRDNFRTIAPMLDASRGLALDTPLGRLLGDYMNLLCSRLGELPPEGLHKLTEAVSSMIEACVAPSPDRLAAASSQLDYSRLAKVRQVVARHLRTPSLGPTMLCRLVGMSRSQLYRLLEDDGGVAHYIQHQRLIESHAVLSDVSGSRLIADIAEELCFVDASSFSRAFRRQFGISPRDVRTAAQAGISPATMPRARAVSGRPGFGECLRPR